jgi:hypothetical protein
MMDIAPFGPSTAIDPLEAIGPSVTTAAVGSDVGRPLGASEALDEAAGEGLPPTAVALGARLSVGVGLPQAAIMSAIVTATGARRSQGVIEQRYARGSGSDHAALERPTAPRDPASPGLRPLACDRQGVNEAAHAPRHGGT